MRNAYRSLTIVCAAQCMLYIDLSTIQFAIRKCNDVNSLSESGLII
jgi:hypothetical protein